MSTGEALPAGTRLVGRYSGLWRPDFEKDRPDVPCSRFDITGHFITRDGARLAVGGSSGGGTKVHVLMYPLRDPGKDDAVIKQALAAVSERAQVAFERRDRVELDVGGARVETAKKGITIRLYGLQVVKKVGSSATPREANQPPDVPVPAGEASKPIALPKAAPTHSRVVATGILDPTKSRRMMRPITSLHFRSSSSDTPRRDATIVGPFRPSDLGAASVDAINPPKKRLRDSSPPTNAISARASPSPKRHYTARASLSAGPSKLPVIIRDQPPVRSEGHGESPSPSGHAAHRTQGAESVHISSFGSPKRTPSNPSADEGGSSLLRRSPVSRKGDSDDEADGLTSSQLGMGVDSDYGDADHDRIGGRTAVVKSEEKPLGALKVEDSLFGDSTSDDELRMEEEAFLVEQAAMEERRLALLRRIEANNARRISRLSMPASGATPVPVSPSRIRSPHDRAAASVSTTFIKREPSPLKPAAIDPPPATGSWRSRSPERQGRAAVKPPRQAFAEDIFSQSIAPAVDVSTSRGASAVGRDLPAVYAATPPAVARVSAGTGLPSADVSHHGRRTVEAAAITARAQTQASEAASRADAVQSREALKQDLVLTNEQGVRTVYAPFKGWRLNQRTNAVGVVVQCKEKKKLGDWVGNIVLTDPSLYDARPQNTDARSIFRDADDDIPITIFRASGAELPPPELPEGAVVLIRTVQVKVWRDKLKGQSGKNEQNGMCWLVGSGGEIMYPPPPHGGAGGVRIRRAAPEEEARMRALARWYESLGFGTPMTMARNSEAPHAARTGKAKSLGDMSVNEFADVTCKILHVHHGNSFSGAQYELYVTDGTRSPLQLWNYHKIDRQSNAAGSSSGGVPLPADAVFVIDIIDEVAQEEQRILKPGNILELPNVRCKTHSHRPEFVHMMWSEKVTEDQMERGYRRKRMTLVTPSEQRAKDINQRIRLLQGDPDANTNAMPRASSRLPGSDTAPGQQHDWSAQRYTGVDAGAGPSRSAPALESPPPAAGIRYDTVPSESTVVPESERIMSTHTDELLHPFSTLEDIVRNKTVPNRYNVKARVKSLHGSGPHAKGAGAYKGLVVKVCKPCKRTFIDEYCKSCNDTALSRACWCYRFIALLESALCPTSSSSTSLTPLASPEEAPFSVLIADEEADAFLPPLPPLQPLSNPNEIKAIERQIDHCVREVFELLMGNKMDGHRVRPVIRWSVESYTAKGRQGGKRKGKGKEKDKGKDKAREASGAAESARDSQESSGGGSVLAYKVFGMTRSR